VKYGIVIIDGGADLPLAALGNRTPLQAARTPTMDAVAQLGRLGTVRTTPSGWPADSDVCTMCLLGYDPTLYHTGRAPLEAASLGVPMTTRAWAFHLHLVTVGEEGAADEGMMLGHLADALTETEARALTTDLAGYWRSEEWELMTALEIYPGTSNSSILIDSSGRTYEGVKTVPPLKVLGHPWDVSLPEGEGPAKASADVLCRLMEMSAEFLPSHPLNAARGAAGKRPVNMCWFCGQGTRPAMPTFASRFGCRGAMVACAELIRGTAALIGWEKLDVAGAASQGRDYSGQGRAACDALDRFDVVCCHAEGPSQAALVGDWKGKVASIEAIDAGVAAPMLQKLMSFGDAERGRRTGGGAGEGWRMLILPDRYTLSPTRKQDATPVPFAMAGSYVRAHRTGLFDEAHAGEADLHIRNGHELMEFFISGGRAAARGIAKGGR